MVWWRGVAVALLATSCAGFVSGCGTYLPDIVISDDPNATAILINKILNHAKCELRDAVIIAHNEDLENAKRYGKRTLNWLDNASAKITIKLIAEEKGALSPGLTFQHLLPSIVTTFGNGTSVTTQQSSSVALGGVVSADATRTENIDYTYIIESDFLENKTNKPATPRPCIQSGGFFLEGNLKVKDWLNGATLPFLISAAVPSEVHDTPPDVLTHEANFVVTVNGNVTPSWTLVHVLVNTANPLVAAGRIATGDLIISLGQPSKVPTAHDISKLNSGFTSAVKSGPP